SSSVAGEMVRLSPTLHDVDIVRHTWGRVCERRHRKDNSSMSSAHAFGIVFYKTLFELDPSLKSIFGKNVIHQARVLAGIMSYLTRSPSIKGESGSQDLQRKMEQQHQEENQWFAYKLREVGIQHIEEYNMVPDHLDALGPALITALKSRLEEEFSTQIEQAW
ncbi:hypothetical protein BCR42DRAFT_300667, partial [Absidia repens]